MEEKSKPTYTPQPSLNAFIDEVKCIPSNTMRPKEHWTDDSEVYKQGGNIKQHAFAHTATYL